MPPPSRREVGRADRAAELLARAGEQGVPPARARRQARVGYLALGVAVSAGIVVPGLLARFHVMHSGAPWLGVMTGVAASLVLDLLPSARQTVGHGGPDADLVTARTLTGLRTVDLDRLARVRRFRTRSRVGWVDELAVTDRSGVGFRFDDRDLAERVAAAVRRSRASKTPDGPGVEVSRFAAIRLGLASAPSATERADRATADFALTILVPLCAALLGALAVWLVASA